MNAALPHGVVTMNVVRGGLDVPDDERDVAAVIASASIDVRVPLC